jgi:hypothetical protein
MTGPTTDQLTLLKAAHRNGGRLPAQSFARYGVFAPYGGTEEITETLSLVAQTRKHMDAVSILLARLDRGQLAMAGGFLGVECRHGTAPGELAGKYVAGIRNGCIRTAGGTPVRPATLAACIRHGWLDTKWRLTVPGWTAAREADPIETGMTITDAESIEHRFPTDADPDHLRSPRFQVFFEELAEVLDDDMIRAKLDEVMRTDHVDRVFIDMPPH